MVCKCFVDSPNTRSSTFRGFFLGLFLSVFDSKVLGGLFAWPIVLPQIYPREAFLGGGQPMYEVYSGHYTGLRIRKNKNKCNIWCWLSFLGV